MQVNNTNSIFNKNNYVNANSNEKSVSKAEDDASEALIDPSANTESNSAQTTEDTLTEEEKARIEEEQRKEQERLEAERLQYIADHTYDRDNMFRSAIADHNYYEFVINGLYDWQEQNYKGIQLDLDTYSDAYDEYVGLDLNDENNRNTYLASTSCAIRDDLAEYYGIDMTTDDGQEKLASVIQQIMKNNGLEEPCNSDARNYNLYASVTLAELSCDEGSMDNDYVSLNGITVGEFNPPEQSYAKAENSGPVEEHYDSQADLDNAIKSKDKSAKAKKNKETKEPDLVKEQQETQTANNKTESGLEKRTVDDDSAKKMLTLAESYEGKESKDGFTKPFFERINYAGADDTTAWCAAFASYVALESGAEVEDWFKNLGYESASCARIYEQAYANNAIVVDPNDVQPGDLVIYDYYHEDTDGPDGPDENNFYYETNGIMDHIGIVTDMNSDGSFSTIEGNTGYPETENGKVGRHDYTLGQMQAEGTHVYFVRVLK